MREKEGRGVLHICHTSLPPGKHKLPKMQDLMLFWAFILHFLLSCVGRLSSVYFELEGAAYFRMTLKDKCLILDVAFHVKF